jgi:hypothetical protein
MSVALTACLQSTPGYASNASGDRAHVQQVSLKLPMDVTQGFTCDDKWMRVMGGQSEPMFANYIRETRRLSPSRWRLE